MCKDVAFLETLPNNTK